MFQCINLFQNGQSILLLWLITSWCTLQNCPELQDFVLILIKFSWGRTPRPPFKQNCLSLYYNHDTASHLKKLKTHTKISKNPPTTIFLANPNQMVSVCLIWKVHCWSFFREWMFERTKKSPWKVLEKGMSWSVGTMNAMKLIQCHVVDIWTETDIKLDKIIGVGGIKIHMWLLHDLVRVIDSWKVMECDLDLEKLW